MITLFTHETVNTISHIIWGTWLAIAILFIIIVLWCIANEK